MAIPSRNLGQRLLLSLGTVVLLLGLGECALRRIYSTLPSLAPLKDDTLQVERYVPPGWEQARPPAPDPDGCHESHPNRDLARPPAWQKEVEGDGEPLRIWALGDSITFGMGVEPEETFAMHLAEKAAAMTGRPVVLSNFGISGANYCTLLRETHRELAFRTPPELLLWNLFADDLQLRSVILTQGALLGFPERIASSWLRPLATHSYLVNLVWVTTRARAGSPPPRFVNMAGQAQFQKAAREFRDHLAQMEITLVTSLISPSGMPLCDTMGETAPRECEWMPEDLQLLDTLLKREEIQAANLSSIWDDRPLYTLQKEMTELETRGRLPIHPNPAGHVLLADAMTPALEQALH